MLVNLQIKDFLLINELELDFYDGLTVITGETGSGKSITIDAMMLIFGAKGNSEIIRAGQNSASFTATFEVSNQTAIAWLVEHDYLEIGETTVICRRVIDINGRSKAYINGQPTTISIMKELGELLLDIHTQHASIALLKSDNQRILLDEFAGVSNDVADLANTFREINILKEKIHTARESSQDLILRQEILREKVADLKELSLKDNEWDELQITQKQLANASLILQVLDTGVNLINGENSIGDLTSTLGSKLAKIGEYLPNYAQISQLIDSIETEINELEHELQLSANKIEQDPEELAIIESRIDEIYSLARKYRIRPEDITEQLVTWQEALESLSSDNDLAALETQLTELEQKYHHDAKIISLARHKVASTLGKNVTELLHKLAITGEFRINLEPCQASSYGMENTQYQVCFNKGMQLQALNKVASGGELSRVALALYVTLSVNNPPEIIVFDEIDVGIGGGVAEVVGNLLHELGMSKQVICITHQPQTACAGDNHLVVSKQIDGDKTVSQMLYTTDNQRVQEIARMLGGLQITDTTIQHAQEMLFKS